MARRLAKPVPLGEEPFDESFQAPVAIVSFRPIEHRKHRRSSDRVDGLTFRHQPGIFFARELTDRVIVGEGLRKRNRYEVQARIGGDLREEVDRLTDYE